MNRLAYIDVFKAISIIAVVLFHSGFLNYGYLGVDIFFVIGGYLITNSLWKRVMNSQSTSHNGNWKEYWSFITGRLVRLLPILLFAGSIAMVFGWFTMLPDDYENLGESVIATSFFSNNILSCITTSNYWDVVNEYKPLMHTWYVGVVMQFYLIYPILFFVAKKSREPRQTLLSIIASLAVISLLMYFGTNSDAGRFYFLQYRFYEFAVGGMVALLYKPSEKIIFSPIFTYICYACLFLLLTISFDFIPDRVRLVLVVALTCALILSGPTLSNKITSNVSLAAVGAASYSIYVWHQVLLAFYRYTVSSHFTFLTYLVFIVVLSIISWLSYKFLEQGITKLLKSRKRLVYFSTATLFVVLNLFSLYIYMVAGVIRDIPELYVSTQDRHRNMHAEYCDRGYQYDKPFATYDKPHWLVVGNSFGRDFVNIILESEIADSVEISYLPDWKLDENNERFSKADRVFISTLGLNESLVTKIEVLCLANGMSPDNITIIGEKDFGESNGQVYAKRNKPNYFDQYVDVEDYHRFIEMNKYYAELYGNRFIDLMAMVCNDEGKVRVFTPDHHFISADTGHLSLGGAKYFAELIDWNKYL